MLRRKSLSLGELQRGSIVAFYVDVVNPRHDVAVAMQLLVPRADDAGGLVATTTIVAERDDDDSAATRHGGASFATVRSYGGALRVPSEVARRELRAAAFRRAPAKRVPFV